MRTLNFESLDAGGRFVLCHQAMQFATATRAVAVRTQLEKVGVAGGTFYVSPAGGSVMLDEADYETLKAATVALQRELDATVAWLEQVRSWTVEQES